MILTLSSGLMISGALSSLATRIDPWDGTPKNVDEISRAARTMNDTTIAQETPTPNNSDFGLLRATMDDASVATTPTIKTATATITLTAAGARLLSTTPATA